MGTTEPGTARSGASLRKLADEELMELVSHHEAAAFEIVLERHVDAAYSLAYRMIERRSLAEEVVWEALLSLWRGDPRYDRSRGSVRNMILGITHRRAVDTLRRDGRRSGEDVRDDDPRERLEAPERTDVATVRHDQARAVRAALDQLPPDQVSAIELAYFSGLTHTEIAAMLHLPVGIVKGHMRLGLEQMRGQLCNRETTA